MAKPPDQIKQHKIEVHNIRDLLTYEHVSGSRCTTTLSAVKGLKDCNDSMSCYIDLITEQVHRGSNLVGLISENVEKSTRIEIDCGKAEIK